MTQPNQNYKQCGTQLVHKLLQNNVLHRPVLQRRDYITASLQLKNNICTHIGECISLFLSSRGKFKFKLIINQSQIILFFHMDKKNAKMGLQMYLCGCFNTASLVACQNKICVGNTLSCVMRQRDTPKIESQRVAASAEIVPIQHK